MNAEFKDHFSAHASDYATARPDYPPAMFAWLAGFAPARDLALDCATGNGQAAVALADHFKRVIATDASAEQLRHAVPRANVEYRQARAEASGLEAGSVDLLMVAQGLHWLEFDEFFAEARRVLKSGGAIAASVYCLAQVNADIDAALGRLYDVVLPEYWPPERMHVDSYYETIPLPFDGARVETFSMEKSWDLKQYLNYVKSWSAVQRYIKRNGVSPLAAFEEEMKAVWPGRQIVRWPLKVRVGFHRPG